MQLELLEKLGDENLAELWVGRLTHAGGQHLVTARRLLRLVAATPGVLEALTRASAVVGGLSHPHLLPHVGFAEAAGEHYWLSLRLEGFDLAMAFNRLASREVHIAPPRALKIAEDLAAGLGALHEAGLVHGGLDPRHVLVGLDGLSRLDGAGYEQALMEIKELKQKARRGRRDSLPPEVLQGRGGSAASDVYSAAAIAYRLLTGQPPLGGEDGGSVSTRHQAIPPPSKLDRSLPFSCDAVFIKALSTAPRSRHESGGALQRALSQLRRAMIEGPDEGAAGVRDFVAGLFPNEAVVPGAPGTLERPARGAPIELAPAAGGDPGLLSPGPGGTPPGRLAPDVAAPARAPQATPAPPDQRSELGGWSAEFEAEPLPLAQAQTPAAPSAPRLASAPRLDSTFGHDEGTDEVDPRPRDTLVMAAVTELEETGDAGQAGTPPPHPRPAWQRPPALAAAGLALVILLVLVGLVWGGAFSSRPGPATLGPPSGPTSLIGFLSVDAGEPAQITLDGELLPGTAPLQRKLVPAGAHRLVLSLPDGRKVLDETVEVAPGEHKEVRLVVPRGGPGLPEAGPAEPPAAVEPAPDEPPAIRKPPKKKTGKKPGRKAKPPRIIRGRTP